MEERLSSRPPRVTPYEILSDERYTVRALRIFAALHPEYAAMDGTRLAFTCKGRLALLARLARGGREAAGGFPWWFGRKPDAEGSDPVLELAFEKIYDHRARERKAQAAARRATGRRDGREFFAAGSAATVELTAGIAAVCDNWGVAAAVMVLRDRADLADYVTERVRAAGIGADDDCEDAFWWLEEDGLIDDNGLTHPHLESYMAGFFEGIAGAWRDYLAYEQRESGKGNA